MEHLPKQEFTAEEMGLIELLKSSPASQEALDALNAWTDAQESWANEVDTSRANIEVNLRRAKLYHAAGFAEEAWSALEDVRQQAHSEIEMELLEEANRLMDEWL